MKNSIRDKRKQQGLSQEELAKKCGVSRQTVNAIENDKYDPTLALAFHLARELDTTVDTLFNPDQGPSSLSPEHFPRRKKQESPHSPVASLLFSDILTILTRSFFSPPSYT